MKAALGAVVVVASMVCVYGLHHQWIAAEEARIVATSGAAAGVGVTLPDRLVFQIKLDHFAFNYCYIFIPILGIAAFVALRQAPGPREPGRA